MRAAKAVSEPNDSFGSEFRCSKTWSCGELRNPVRLWEWRLLMVLWFGAAFPFNVYCFISFVEEAGDFASVLLVKNNQRFVKQKIHRHWRIDSIMAKDYVMVSLQNQVMCCLSDPHRDQAHTKHSVLLFFLSFWNLLFWFEMYSVIIYLEMENHFKTRFITFVLKKLE